MKIKNKLFQRLIVEAQEAEELGLKKISNGILRNLKQTDVLDSTQEFSKKELKEKVNEQLWKSAMLVFAYHGLESVDSLAISKEIDQLTNEFVDSIEEKVNRKDSLGEFEPKLCGEE